MKETEAPWVGKVSTLAPIHDVTPRAILRNGFGYFFDGFGGGAPATA
jgi:hypothetical protein